MHRIDSRIFVLAFFLLFFCAVDMAAGDQHEVESRVDFGFRCTYDGEQGGIHVLLVHPGSPAERAGFLQDDVVLSIDGNALRFENDLEMIRFLGKFEVDETIDFQVRRGSSILELEMLGEPMSEERRVNLQRWLDTAEKRLSSGHDLYCEHCVDEDESWSEGEPFSDSLPERWVLTLSRVTAHFEMTISKSSEGKIEIKPQVEGILPEGFSVSDLDPTFAKLANTLDPGDSFGLTISRNEDGTLLAEPTSLPPYLKELLVQETKSVSRSTVRRP